MKNKIYIDIDSERKDQILLGKGNDIPQPTNEEEAKDMVLMDIVCLTEALITLIHVADQNKYGEKKAIVNQAIASLNQYLELEVNDKTDDSKS
jgi:hypothetical protein